MCRTQRYRMWCVDVSHHCSACPTPLAGAPSPLTTATPEGLRHLTGAIAAMRGSSVRFVHGAHLDLEHRAEALQVGGGGQMGSAGVRGGLAAGGGAQASARCSMGGGVWSPDVQTASTHGTQHPRHPAPTAPTAPSTHGTQRSLCISLRACTALRTSALAVAHHLQLHKRMDDHVMMMQRLPLLLRHQ